MVFPRKTNKKIWKAEFVLSVDFKCTCHDGIWVHLHNLTRALGFAETNLSSAYTRAFAVCVCALMLLEIRQEFVFELI